jgi:hypothetical protein
VASAGRNGSNRRCGEVGLQCSMRAPCKKTSRSRGGMERRAGMEHKLGLANRAGVLCYSQPRVSPWSRSVHTAERAGPYAGWGRVTNGTWRRPWLQHIS